MGRRKMANQTPVSPKTSSVPPEIWSLIGAQISCQETLGALIRVCRDFRVIFTPILAGKQTLQLHRLRPLLLPMKELPPLVHHAKELEIRTLEFCESGVEYHESYNPDYVKFIEKYLKSIPNLGSFTWYYSAFEDSYGPCAILRESSLLNVLKGCKTLKRLSIQFSNEHLDDPDSARLLWNCPLNGFENLTSLELYQFYGDQDALVQDIAGAMSRCPNLHTLGLGYACDADCDVAPETMLLEGEVDFLEKLCLRYASKREELLPLKKLRLGQGVCLSRATSPEVGNYLLKVVDPAGLEELHVFNGMVAHIVYPENSDYLSLDWFLLEGCKSLRQLCVTRLEEDVRLWLNGDGQSVEELIISDPQGYPTKGLYEYKNLRLPHLSMLSTQQTVNTDSDVIPDLIQDPNGDTFTDGVLKRPLTADPATMTVLDRLYDGGAHLTRLSICIKFEIHWDGFSQNLPHLIQLKDLRLRSMVPGYRRFPPPSASRWRGITRSKDIAIRYVYLMHSRCPSLQRIRIGDWAWRIQYNPAPQKRTRSYELVELQELTQQEILSIEVFNSDTFYEQGGLPGPEEPWEYQTDEQITVTERRLVDFRRMCEAEDSDGIMPYTDWAGNEYWTDASDDSLGFDSDAGFDFEHGFDGY